MGRRFYVLGDLLEITLAVLGSIILLSSYSYIISRINTPMPSYFYLNSHTAEIGIFPAEDLGDYLIANYTRKCYLKDVPFAHNGKIYLPLRFVAVANGIKENNIFEGSDGRLIITKADENKVIIFDSKEKAVVDNGEKINIGDSLLMNDKEMFIESGYIEKIFNMKVKKEGDKIILIPQSFPNPLLSLFKNFI
ncbi:stalk domain-containing protein [Caldanaerobacter subterraneus]|uniref:Copper amine oxidase-like protein n=1 Tax=Caldanaerobacter subterraneus TaxID=911092 RepID=A0A4R2JDT1_9THEO|nr:stalk domain-containing protein [Caldanaerobacter subterraneus]TCO57801.1 copper amine oxidase-like protein [Caldanaerobacter subterraneus]